MPQPHHFATNALSYPVALRFAATDERGEKSSVPRAIPTRPGERLLGKRVLIVEDEGLVALELQLAFEDEGAEIVGPAQTLMGALEVVAHAGAIDLAVLDVDLAGESVYPVAELLHQRGVAFAFHTGHGSRSELAALFPGTATFIKPTLSETLVQHLVGIAG